MNTHDLAPRPGAAEPSATPGSRSAAVVLPSQWLNVSLGSLLVAVVLVAATLAVVWPGQWRSIVGLGAGTATVAAATLSVLTLAPAAARDPEPGALDRLPPAGAPPLDPPGLRDARRSLTHPARDTPRPLVPGTPTAVSDDVWRRLVVGAVLRFQDAGIDIENPATRERARTIASPALWALLTTPAAPASGSIRSPVAVARTVHAVLDELDDGLTGPGPSTSHRRHETPGARHGHR